MFLKLYRTSDWIHVLGLPVLGFMYAQPAGFDSASFFICILISIFYLAHGYSLNEVFDVYKGPKEKFTQEDKFNYRKALIVAYLPVAINLFISRFVSLEITFLVAAGAVLSYLYSAPPVKCKGRPGIEIFCNSLGFSILFLIGYNSLKNLDAHSLMLAGLFFILFIPIQLIHEIDHLERDKIEKVNTTVSKYGVSFSLKVIYATLLGFVFWNIFLWLRGEINIFFFCFSTLFSLILIFYLVLNSNKKRTGLNVKKLKVKVRFLIIIYGFGILAIKLIPFLRNMYFSAD